MDYAIEGPYPTPNDFPGEIKKVTSIVFANLKKIAGIAIANIRKVTGIRSGN